MLLAGQRQRIPLSRARLGNPRIMVLNEATSNVDVTLEAKILDKLRSTAAAVLLIANRPKAWTHADRIDDLGEGLLTLSLDSHAHDEDGMASEAGTLAT